MIRKVSLLFILCSFAKDSAEHKEKEILKENIAREKEAHEEIAKMKIKEAKLKGEQEDLSKKEIDQMVKEIKAQAKE